MIFILKKISLVFLLLNCVIVRSQKNDAQKWQSILKSAQINKTVTFGKWNENGGEETHLTYLGSFKTSNGKVFKIVNSTWIWGNSHRATSRVLIFDGKNQYYGNYGLGMIDELPEKLQNGKLIFTNFDNKDCDKKLKTIISLSKGFPKEIFIKCKKDYGEFYSLDNSKFW